MKKRPGLKPSTQAAIESRRRMLRSGRSVRQVSRDQYDLDSSEGEWRKVRNRMRWATDPTRQVARIGAS